MIFDLTIYREQSISVVKIYNCVPIPNFRAIVLKFIVRTAHTHIKYISATYLIDI